MATKVFPKPSRIDGINPNILHNAYFRGGGSQGGVSAYPINQRMQSSYSAAGYTIDRWIMSADAELSFTDPISPSLISDSIKLKKTAAGDDGVFLSQKLENIISGPQTFSALVRVDLTGSGADDAGNLHLAVKAEGGTDLAYEDITASSSDPILVVVTYDGSSESVKSVNILLDEDVPVDGYVDIIACKLELGTRQTLAHRSNGEWVLNEPVPDHTVELMKCQRYFQLMYNSFSKPSSGKAIDFRPVMCAEPTESTISHGGHTYYAYSADL